MNGIMYVLSTGCQWRAIPKDLPPRSTVHDDSPLVELRRHADRIHHALYVECRERGKREASPTAAIIDSQSVKSAERGPVSIRMALMRARRSKARSATSCRYAGFVAPRHRSPRRYPGSLRRYPASCHSVRDVSVWKKLFADGGYQGPEFQRALTKLLPQLETEIIKRSDHAKGFVASRRWVVERTIAGLNRCRRLAKDWENLNRKALASGARDQPAHAPKTL